MPVNLQKRKDTQCGGTGWSPRYTKYQELKR